MPHVYRKKSDFFEIEINLNLNSKSRGNGRRRIRVFTRSLTFGKASIRKVDIMNKQDQNARKKTLFGVFIICVNYEVGEWIATV